MTGTTIVLDINITNTEERREWSYLELVENHLLKNGDEKGVEDPFSEADMLEQKKLVDLAKSLERKYGTMVTMKKSGKRKRIRIDDFLDPGEGYDTQDSFIDDSEAVDVYVAPNVSTKHGGFFVYEGALEGLEDESIEIEAPIGAKQPSSGVLSRPVAMKNKSKELLEKAVKRLSASKQSAAAQRRKLANLDSVVDAVLSRSEQSSSPAKSAATESPAAKPVPNTPTESVPPMTNNKLKTVPAAVSESPKQSSPSPQSQQQQQVDVSPPPLPPSLSSDITSSVSNLIKLGSASGGTQRRVIGKPFEAELLNLAAALNAANVTPAVRSTVFAHVEGVLQWKRKSLTRRLKKLNEANEDQKMNPSLDALGDAIARAMPPLLEGYMRDKELHAERIKAWQAENAEQNEAPPTTADGAAAAPPKRNPKPGAPKKLFRWNVECRHLFESIVTLRLQSYHTLNVKGPREEYLRNLFPTLIQLWPDGWITNAALWRAALPVFQKFTASHPTTNHVSGKQSTPTTSTPSPVTPSVNPVVSTGSIANGPSVPKTKSPQSVSQSSGAQRTESPTTAPAGSSQPLITSSPYTSVVPSSTTAREPIFQQLQSKPNPTVYLTNVTAPSKSSTETPSPTQEALRTMLNSKVAQLRPPAPDAGSKQHTILSSPPSIHSSVRVTTPPTVIKNKTTGISSHSHSIRASLLMHNRATTGSQSTPTVVAPVTTSTPRSHTGQMQAPPTSRPIKNDGASTTVSFRLPSINTLYVNTNAHQHSIGISRPSLNSPNPQISPVYSPNQQQRRYTEPTAPAKPLMRTVPMQAQQTVQQTLISPTTQSQKRAYVTAATGLDVGVSGKQPAYQVVHPSPAIALSSSQIDQLQQRALASSTTRPSQSGNSAALSAANTVLIQRQPPPAHQQTMVTQAYHQRLSEQFVSFASTAHASLFIGDVKIGDPRLIHPRKKE